MLTIHNSLTRRKEEFVPITPGEVRMYVCGMTVYDYCHLGHARVMVAFDVVRRWLRALGYRVTYVRNITDIDDKIIKRARENNEPAEALTARFIQAMDEDAAALGIEKPDAEPRATDFVPGMLDMIRALEGRGLAYQAPDGDVNYAVRKFPEYGRLSGKSLDELRAGERVEIDAAKHDPLDFVLWKRARDGEPTEALTARFIQAMDEDAARLGIEKPDFEPRATEYVEAMLDMIRVLEGRGLAYQAPDGDVNYAVRKFPEYGRLSGKSLDELRAGERVEIDAAKHDPLDFVLWKRAKDGEPYWDAPWGRGRPGWHIECSAMSNSLLGRHFDIHGGGQDLQFPHHENEIAQSEGAHREKFVNYWMHNGFVRVDNEKMSKSLGNFFTVREVRAKYDPEVIRFFIVRAHYRSPLNYSDQHLEDAKHALTRLYTALRGIDAEAGDVDWQNPYASRFREAMNDDFNTPEAVAALFELANEVNRTRSSSDAGLLKSLAATLGLLQR
ncbi:MAG TPA: cysteine--tRNA ligase, partial [Steroidobacteraceae bacterium]